ncbi:hypothetical protein F4819DRAFT_257264 [Hypoxylon fuscum]|nr:hypothetical protein F4819DRAFT_257264 [Hypoxylon fuscum]
MKSFTIATVFGLLLAAPLNAAPSPADSVRRDIGPDCNCQHNNDAGRWKDGGNTPAYAVSQICGSSTGTGCYTASGQGKLCIQGDVEQCQCIEDASTTWQSQHGDWFLWTAITCNGLSLSMTAS